jgi:hypothetical protein
MNAVIAVIRWIAAVPAAGPAATVAFAAAAPVAPPAGQDIPLSLVEAGMASHYIRVTVSGGVACGH